MGRRTPFRQAPGTGFVDQARQRREAVERQLNAFRASEAAKREASAREEASATPPRLQRDSASLLDALGTVPLYRIGNPEPMTASSAYRVLVETAVATMNSGEATAVLCWPAGQPCLSGLVALLALADISAAPKTEFSKGGTALIGRDRPGGIRVALYPYARTTHTAAREVQIDRDILGSTSIQHSTRHLAGDDDEGLKDYHQVLARVRKLTGKALDGSTYAEFEHPVLDEIVPHGSARSGCPQNGRLLWRTKSKTDLGAQSRNGLADDAGRARFFLYTIHHTDQLRRELAAIGSPPDLLILDMSRRACNRLGRDWRDRTVKAVEEIRSAMPTVGIMAVTEDPWTYDFARFELLATKPSAKKGRPKPARCRIIFETEDSIVSPASPVPPAAWEGAVRIKAGGFLGTLDTVVDELRSINAKLRNAGDETSAEAVRMVMTKLKRAACLPGSLAEYSEFLETTANDVVAADTMTGYTVSAEMNDLTSRDSAALDISPEIADAKRRAAAILTAAERTTPMVSLLDEAIGPALRSSSRTVFVFRNESLSDFAVARIMKRDAELGKRLDKNMIRFSTQHGLTDISKLSPSDRRQYKRAVIVAPTRATILQILAMPWLPDDVEFLADADTLRFAARDATRLSNELYRLPIGDRLGRFAKAANDRVTGIGGHIVQLDTPPAPSDDVEFPAGGVVDLRSGAGGRGDRTTYEIILDRDRCILARPGTGIVVRSTHRSIMTFVDTPAKDVKEGDEVCVIGPAFIEKARTLLNITARAAEQIRDYHELVQERFGALAGNNISERLRALADAMGAPSIDTGTARYWVTLDQEFEKPLHDVVPHAPKDKPTFMRFTAALKIGPQTSERFWAWAVIAQRSNRLRAGAAFHDAYKGILTDPHGAIGDNAEREADIRALRAAALEHIATVSDIRVTREA
jgi:hypothetical protein